MLSTLPASTMFESWLPMDSETFRKGNCNAKSHKSNFRGAAHLDGGFNHLRPCADFVFPATIRASHRHQCILI